MGLCCLLSMGGSVSGADCSFCNGESSTSGFHSFGSSAEAAFWSAEAPSATAGAPWATAVAPLATAEPHFSTAEAPREAAEAISSLPNLQKPQLRSSREDDPAAIALLLHHQLLDPVGQAFAAYDLDATGEPPAAEVISHPELEGSYASVGDLLAAVAESRAFSECFARHWLSSFLEMPLRSVDASWSNALADSIREGASLGAVVEQTVSELAARSEANTPWCQGE